MKNLYPKIKFVYSFPYDRLLTKYESKAFSKKQADEIEKYIKKIQSQWNKINDSVCQALEEIIKNKWQKKEIKCYVVKYCKYTGISNPLTIELDPDFDFVLATLIHELAHILVCHNIKKYRKIEQRLKRQFPKVRGNRRTILHIYINFVELQVLKKIFSPGFVNKILKKERTFKGIKKAWRIVLSKEDVLKKTFHLIKS